MRPQVSAETVAAVDTILDERSQISPDRIGFEHKIEVLMQLYIKADRQNAGDVRYDWAGDCDELAAYR